MPWDFALILVFFAVAVPLLGRRRIRQLLAAPRFSSLDRLRLYASTIAFQWLASALVLWRIHARAISSASLGAALPHPFLALAAGLVLSLFLLANQLVALRRLAARPSDSRATLPRIAAKIFPQNPAERLAFFAVVSTVAVCEEWIYRGFVQRVFTDAAGGLALAGLAASALLFGFAHLYQGRRGVISTGILGAVFSASRLWTGSLLPTIAAHFVADLTVGLLAPGVLRRQAEAAAVAAAAAASSALTASAPASKSAPAPLQPSSRDSAPPKEYIN